MREIINSLKKRKVFSILTIIQLTVVMLLLLHSITSYRTFSYNIIKTNQLLNTDNVMVFDNEKMYNEAEGNTNKIKLLNLYNYAKNNIDIDGYGTFLTSTVTLIQANKEEYKNNELIKYLCNSVKTKTIGEEEIPIGDVIIDDLDGKTSVLVPSSIIDEGFNKMAHISVIKGRGFKKGDFNLNSQDTIPIILGYKYKNVVRIGDKIKMYSLVSKTREYTTYEVIGILKKDTTLPTGGGNLLALTQNMDYGVIRPVCKGFYDIPLNVHFAVGLNFIYEINNTVRKKEIINDFNSKIKELNLDFKSIPISKEIEDYKSNKKEIYSSFILKTILLGIFIQGGLISAFAMYVLLRKTEFGIRIAAGATKWQLVKMIFGEVLVLLFISSVISIITFIFILNKFYILQVSAQIYRFDYIVVLQVLFIVILVSLVSAAVPAYRILKLQPKDLIGGME